MRDLGLRPGGKEAAPCPASLGFDPATPMQPSAPPAADPTRVGSRPDPGFARWGEAAPSHASLGFGPATPLQSSAPSNTQAESGQDPNINFSL